MLFFKIHNVILFLIYILLKFYYISQKRCNLIGGINFNLNGEVRIKKLVLIGPAKYQVLGLGCVPQQYAKPGSSHPLMGQRAYWLFPN